MTVIGGGSGGGGGTSSGGTGTGGGPSVSAASAPPSPKKAPKGGELPLDHGATPYTAAPTPEASDDKNTVTPTDKETKDDLVLTDIVDLGISDPSTAVGADTAAVLTKLGTLVAHVPPTGVTVVLSTMIFPVVAATDHSRVQNPITETGLLHLVDVDNGEVPAEDGVTKKLRTPPQVVRTFKVNEAVYEMSTGKYFVCDHAGSTLGKWDATDKLKWYGDATFKVLYGTIKETLDDWDDIWGPDIDYTFDYEEFKDCGREKTGGFKSTVVPYPADWLKADDALFTDTILASAAKRLFPRNATFKIGATTPTLLTDASKDDGDWAKNLRAVYEVDKRFHPSIVGALRAAIQEAADERDSDINYQVPTETDPAKIAAALKKLQEDVQKGYTGDAPGAAWDLKQADDNKLIKPLDPS